MRSLPRLSLIAGCIIALATVALYFTFSAEDAFIVARYAENLAQGNGLVFNVGERISALTSPLHALIEAGLFMLTGSSVGAWKIMALGLVITSVGTVVYHLWEKQITLTVFVPLVLVCAPMWLWAVGGLETGLLLFLATMMGVACHGLAQNPIRNFIVLCILAGLAVITRYDAVLFAAPVVLAAAWQIRDWRLILPGYLLGGAITLSWLIFAYVYFGEILPTSFFVKSPSNDPLLLVINGLYIFIFLVVIPIVPVLTLSGLLERMYPAAAKTTQGAFTPVMRRGILIGIGLMLAYGTTMATTHMMFSFRFFVPYVPLLAWLVALQIERFERQLSQPTTGRKIFRVVLGLIWVLPLVNVVYTYTNSMNGFTFIGEYALVSLHRHNTQFVPTLHNQADIIEEHWAALENTPDRPPRLLTYAAGIVPYEVRDAYTIENLISYRYARCALVAETTDYIMMMASIEYTLPDNLVLLDEQIFPWDRRIEHFQLWYNPDPLPNNIPAEIDAPCLYDPETESPPDDLLSNTETQNE